MEILHEMDDSQLETTLIRLCLALPKFSYLIRTCPPTYISRATRDFDVAMKEALESILGVPLSEWPWLKASLPSSHGGVNLRSASLHAPTDFMASSSHSKTLVGKMLKRAPGLSPHISFTVAALSFAAFRPDWQCLEDIDVPLGQYYRSPSMRSCLLSLAPSTRARTQALSSALPHAGDWLNGVPSAALGLLHDREFCSCLRYWLGVPLHSTSYFCPECHSTADPFGDY